jgi:predicted amidohydrolase
VPDHTLDIGVLQIAYDATEHLDARLQRVLGLLHEHADADLLVLPELWAHGAFTPARWREESVTLDDPVIRELGTAAVELGLTLHAGSFIEGELPGGDPGPQGRGLWNTSVVLGADGTTTTYRKIHRFGFGEGEPIHLEAGTGRRTVSIRTLAADTVMGLATCYDLRFPELFRAHLADEALEIFLIPASWPAPRVEHWRLLGRARAVENQAYVVQANICGSQGGLQMAGASQIVAPDGRLVASAGAEPEVLRATLDLSALRSLRADFPVLADRRIPVGG